MDDRAASETVGTILLVGIMVLGSTVAGVVVVAQTNAIGEQTERTQLNVKTEVNETTVTVRHVGGPAFNASDVRILVRGDSGSVGPYTLDAAAVDGSGLADGTFEVGDAATIDHSFTGYVDVFLFSTERNERLYRTLRSTQPPTAIPTPAGGAPIARPSALDRVAEGYNITLDGSASTDPDGSIQDYSWSIASGSGTIVEDDTATPNATYRAPANVTGNQTVTISLTVEDDDGNTHTASIEVTVVDLGAVTPPQDATGDGAAFDDDNGNGLYDDGEGVVSKEDLEDGYNDPTSDLVIYPEVGEITTSGSAVDITANTITAGTDFTANGDTIRLTAEGDIRIEGVTLDANSNQGITVTSFNGSIYARGSTMTANNGPIELNADGDIDLRSANLDSGSSTADLTRSSGTLYVEGLSLAGRGNSGGTLVYDPDNITVVGTPSQGTVSPT